MLSLLLGLISLVRRPQGTQGDVSEEARDGQRHEHGVPSDPVVDSGEVEAEVSSPINTIVNLAWVLSKRSGSLIPRLEFRIWR